MQGTAASGGKRATEQDLHNEKNLQLYQEETGHVPRLVPLQLVQVSQVIKLVYIMFKLLR